MPLTAGQIADRLGAAAITLRRLPNPAGSGPRGYGNAWPDVVQERHVADDYNRVRMRITPSPHDIALMEEALGWIALLNDPVDRRIIWMRCDGERWRAICHRVGLTRQTCNRRFNASVLTLEKKLKQRGGRSADA